MLEGINEDEEAEEEEEAKRNAQTKKTCTQVIVIHPQKSTFKQLWDFCIFICLGISLFMIPLTLGFNTEKILEKTHSMELTFDIFFAVNILFNFITAYQ